MGTRITFITELMRDEAKVRAVEKQLQYEEDKQGEDCFSYQKHFFKGSYYFTGITKTLDPHWSEAHIELSDQCNTVWVSDENTHGFKQSSII